MSGLSFLKSSRRSPSTDHSAKKRKEVDEWKHSGLTSAAKYVLKQARHHMGTLACPCRSEDLRVMMIDCRAGRYGQEPWGSVIKIRVVAMLADKQTGLIWAALEADENGGLDTSSTKWQIAVVWSVIGDIFVMFWAIKQGATQLSTVALDLDGLYNAVTVADPSDAVAMWSGVAFANGAPSPATKLVKCEADAAAARVAATPKLVEAPELHQGGQHTKQATGKFGRDGKPWVLRCNYCFTMRNRTVDTSHVADKCPHNSHKPK